MPWDISSVDSHKKGLNPSQKKKWIKIANHTLKRCLKDKGKDCEGMAIRVANSLVGKRLTK